MYDYTISTEEMEAEGSEVRGHPCLHKDVNTRPQKKASLVLWKSKGICMIRALTHGIWFKVAMLYFAALLRYFMIEIFLEENLDLLPGIHLCP